MYSEEQIGSFVFRPRANLLPTLVFDKGRSWRDRVAALPHEEEPAQEALGSAAMPPGGVSGRSHQEKTGAG